MDQPNSITGSQNDRECRATSSGEPRPSAPTPHLFQLWPVVSGTSSSLGGWADWPKVESKYPWLVPTVPMSAANVPIPVYPTGLMHRFVLFMSRISKPEPAGSLHVAAYPGGAGPYGVEIPSSAGR